MSEVPLSEIPVMARHLRMGWLQRHETKFIAKPKPEKTTTGRRSMVANGKGVMLSFQAQHVSAFAERKSIYLREHVTMG